MEQSCFCETDKYAYPSIWDRIFCCICSGIKERLIKLECCSKYVHKSCFINSAIIHRNNILNSKDTLETTKFSEIDICHYCRDSYDRTQFPNIPTSEGIQIKNKNRILEVLLPTCWIIILLLIFGNALGDNILLGTHKNKGIELYKHKFIDNCELNYTGIYNTSNDIHDYCHNSFLNENEWTLGVVPTTSIAGFMIIIVGLYLLSTTDETSIIYSFVDQYIIIEFLPLWDTSFYHTVKDYRTSIEKCTKIYKSNCKKLIIPSIILTWQLVYLFLILGYNLWYIPSHTSPDTTVEEARKLTFYYIPILCFFNVFWFVIICAITIPIIFGIICLILLCVECCTKMCVGCANCCIECVNFCAEERNKVKNNISLGDNNIKLYSIDIDDSLKKSTIV